MSIVVYALIMSYFNGRDSYHNIAIVDSDSVSILSQPDTTCIDSITPIHTVSPHFDRIPAKENRAKPARSPRAAPSRMAPARTPAMVNHSSDNAGAGKSTTGTSQGNSSKAGPYRGTFEDCTISGRIVTVCLNSVESSRPGKVVVRITVNREGRQTSRPRIISNTTGDKSIEAECLRAARETDVSAAAGAPAEESGCIIICFL